MTQYSFLESKAARVFFGLYLTAMLFLSRDTLFSSCIVGFQKSQLYMLILIVFLGFGFLLRNLTKMKQILLDQRMLVCGIFVAALLLPMLIKQDWQLMYFSILLCPLFAVFLTYFISSRDVAKYYVVILCVLGMYSVIATYGLRELAQAGKMHPDVFFNSNQWDFYNFVFAYAVSWESWNRNFGIFREPGVYQFFVLLAIYLNNYMVNWDRIWKLWFCNIVLAVTMITTFAIGGYAELGLFLLFLYMDKKYYREKWGRIAGVSVVLLIIGAICYIVYYYLMRPDFGSSIFYEFYDMLLRLFTKSDSSTDRIDAILTNLQFFLRGPLVGERLANVLHGTNHNTSSTLLLYAIFGIVGGTLNVLAWVMLTWKQERNLFGNLVLLLILFMSFNTQNLTANVFFWLFPMMALIERGLPLTKLPVKKE